VSARTRAHTHARAHHTSLSQKLIGGALHATFTASTSLH
jgi:hypothetical protein